ncbi:MAG: hypothetical protein HYU67_05185 [Flavobacteriia bacterium]|nr:hypothetical protein [Flavobacteriia bacterium]
MNKIAVIDLGTNTFQLSIYQCNRKSFSLLFSHRVGVSLGLNGILEKKIHREALDRGIETMTSFKKMCDDWQVEKINAVGTSALRDASNNKEFCNEILSKTGIQIEIINGLKEAELIYKGVIKSFKKKEDCVIMDIGGGSTEIIYVLNKKPEIFSFNIGISRLFQLKNWNDPFSKDDIAFLIDAMEKECSCINSLPNINNFIGVAGSFETVYEMIKLKAINSFNSTLKFNSQKMYCVIQELINSSMLERTLNPHIIPIRKQFISIAALQMKWFLDKIQAKNKYISTNSLSEGVLFDFMNKKAEI